MLNTTLPQVVRATMQATMNPPTETISAMLHGLMRMTNRSAPDQMNISPERAQLIQQLYPFAYQREIDQKQLNKLVTAMREGRFPDDTQIVFSHLLPDLEKGVLEQVMLVDGNHRVTALIATGHTARFQVVVKTFTTMRQVQEDALIYNQGWPNSTQQQARILDLPGRTGLTKGQLEQEFRAINCMKGDWKRRPLSLPVHIMEPLALKYADAMRQYLETNRRVEQELRTRLRSPEVTAFAILLFEYSPKLAAKFCYQLAHPNQDPPLKATDPCRRAGQYLIAHPVGTIVRGQEHTCRLVVLHLIAAYNAFREGRDLAKLQVHNPDMLLSIPGTSWNENTDKHAERPE